MNQNLTRVKGWDGDVPWSWEGVTLAVLVEIRDELKSLNSVMQCDNVRIGFRALTKIAARDDKAFKKRVANATQKRLKRAR